MNVINRVIYHILKKKFSFIKLNNIVIKVNKGDKNYDFVCPIKNLFNEQHKIILKKYINNNILKKDIYQNLFLKININDHFMKVKIANFGNNFFLTNILTSLQHKFNEIWIKNKKQNITVEFGSINPVGNLHIGNFRNICIGNLWSIFYKFLNYNIKNIYLVNDVGHQLQLLIYNIKNNKNNDYKQSILWLKMYKNEIFNLKNEKIIKKKVVNFFFKQHKLFLKKNNFKIDKFYYESEINVNKFINYLLKYYKNLIVKGKEKSLYIIYNKNEKKKEIIIKSNGDSTYFLRDLSNFFFMSKKNDNIKIIVGFDHELYIKKMISILCLLNINNITFFIHQYVNYNNKKISKRNLNNDNKWLLNDIIFFKKLFYFYPNNKTINIKSKNIQYLKKNFNHLIKYLELDINKQIVVLNNFYKNINFIIKNKKINLFYCNFIKIYSLIYFYKKEYKFIEKLFKLFKL